MKKRILITDDTEEILLNLQEYLEMEGYQVSIARNGKQALAQVEISLPDLIITDLLMSEMTGFELIKELKKKKSLSKIPVLVFSAKPMDENTSIKRIGADRFVLKPSLPEVLIEQINDLLNKAK
jgi:two-component system alkaline phosphatase synthesis response regulator PhoP